MPVESRLAELLACPRCDKAPLHTDNDLYHCSACKIDFPFVGPIPWLFADPDSSLGEWRNRLHYSLQNLSHEAQRLKAEMIAEDRQPLTRRRL